MDQSGSKFYEFDEFSVDTGRRLLSRGGQPISLTPKVFDTLLVFLENPGDVLDKDRLMQELWSDSFVEEANIAQNVAVLRRTLGEKPRENRFIATIPGCGYRFVAEVKVTDHSFTSEPITESTSGPNLSSAVASIGPETAGQPERQPIEESVIAGSPRHRPNRIVYLSIGAVLLIAATVAGAFVYIYTGRPAFQDKDGLTTLAVLPFKPVDSSDDYLGLGVADSIIRRISQTGNVTVRPASAVRRYLNQDIDALSAARELGVDTVLEGTIQRAGDRLRVSVNLLRANDGKSLWADNYDLTMSDVFAVQDTVAQHVALSLRLRLDPQHQRLFRTRNAPNAIAYEYYLKGLYSFDQRGFDLESKPQHEATIDLFKKSIEVDPEFAPAHAQLAYAYAWMAIYVDEKAQDEWVERAEEEISRADDLDPQLAETHIARHHVLLSAHEGFQIEAAAHELILAKKLDPNIAGIDLSVAYNHLGLEDLFDREMQRTLEIDPTSEFNKRIFGYQLIYAARYDDWLAYRQKYFDGKPNYLYLLGKGRLDDAEKLVAQQEATYHLDQESMSTFKAFVYALKGDSQAAESEIPAIVNKLPYKNNSYHHVTYDIACIYALVGNSGEAVHWLKETAATGFPDYPLFQRDHYLDPIRQSPEFVEFMAKMKSQNNRLKQEFSD